MSRILLTGSRDWPDAQQVFEVLDELRARCRAMVLVHGACPRGVDKLGSIWASQTRGVTLEQHPAKWNLHGKAAGMIRNQAMVDRGADLCVAFIFNGSRGATHCADAAEKAGIPVTRYAVTAGKPLLEAAQALTLGEGAS